MKGLRPETPRDWIKLVLTVVGLLLLAYLIRKFGLGNIRDNIARFGPRFLMIFALGAVYFLVQALAWWVIQKSFFRRLPLARLFRIKMISAAFNIVMPSASLGGDAMRAFLIKEHIPLKQGVPSVLFDKTIEFIGSLVFLIGGFLLGSLTLRLPRALTVPVIISLGITAAATVALVLLQKAGVTKTLKALGRRIPGGRAWVAKRESQLRTLDESLRLFYKRSNTMALIPLGLHILGRLIGVFEVMFIMAVLNAPIRFIPALFLNTVVTAGNTVFFLLPGQWGVTEGLNVLVLRSLGYTAAIGLSLSIIRRIRSLFFAGVGLVLFAMKKDKPRKREAS